MRKIGLLGGTFSPIHNGHIELAKRAYNAFSLDEVWFIPSGISYMKRDQKIPSGQIRLEMVSHAIENTSYFKASDIEIKRQGNSYTYETLQELKNLYPDDTFYFIIGDDTLFTMESWYKPEEIFRLATILVMVRDFSQEAVDSKCEELKEKYGATALSVKAPAIDISSSVIRKRIQDRLSISDLVPDSVEKYIKENQLYEL